MQSWWIMSAFFLSLGGSYLGWKQFKEGAPKYWMLGLMGLIFCVQLAFLYERGEARGQCPLQDKGEFFVFLSWSLVGFYLITGSLYRLSLLGLFTAPMVAVFLGVALLPGFLERGVVAQTQVNPWAEVHAAFSVLSYGALGLATIASVMFLLLNDQLKKRKLESPFLFRFPTVRRLSFSMQRLLAIGWGLLTVGVCSGWRMEGVRDEQHLYVALCVWVLYTILLAVVWLRGLPAQYLAMSLIALFLISFLVFGLI